MSAQTISVFPLASTIASSDVLLGNRSSVTSRFPIGTITQYICAAFLENDSFVFVPAGATIGEVVAFDGSKWTTSSKVPQVVIAGSYTPRAALDVNGGVRALQGAPAIGDTSNFGYAFEGDGDTGMFSIPPPGGNSNGSLSFFLNQTEAMRLAAGGNVGIGIANPQDKLHVGGGLIASQIKTNDPAAIFEIIGGTSKPSAKASISVKGIGEIEFSTGNIPARRVNINNSGLITFYNPIIGTFANFANMVTSPLFAGNIAGALGNFTTSVTSPLFIGNLQGNVNGATGNFTTSVTAPLFIGNLQGNVSGATGNFTTSVTSPLGNFTTRTTSPLFLGNLQGNVTGNITGATGNFSTSVTAPLFRGSITGPTGFFTTSVTSPLFTGNMHTGALGNFTTSVTSPLFIGNLQGNVNGATGNFTTSVTAPLFIGNITGATGNFSTSVTAPTFIGNLQGNVNGATGNFSTSVTAPIFNGNLLGTAATVDQLNITRSGTTLGSIYSASANVFDLEATGTNTALRLKTNLIERARITADGKFGVKTTTPTDVLHVAANDGTFATGTRPSTWGGGITTWDLYAGGTIGAGSATGSLSSYINKDGYGWFRTAVGAGATLGSLSARMEKNGGIYGAIGNFTMSVTAPTFIGNVNGTTGNFTTSVTSPLGNFTTRTTSPLFLGNLQGNVTGNIAGTTGNFSSSVNAPAVNGAFTGDGAGIYNLKNFPFAPIKTVNTFAINRIYNLTSVGVADINLILILAVGTQALTVGIPVNTTYDAPVGTQLIIIQQGTGAISFSPGTGVTLTSVTNKRKIYGDNAAAVLIKIGTNSWFLGGDIKA